MRASILPALASALALVAVALCGRPAFAAGVNPQATFAQNCSACHQLTGKGVPGAFPALAGVPFVTGDPHKVVLTLLNGRGGMPSFRNDLTDDQIAAAISYIRSSWGNHAAPVTPGAVTKLRGAASSEKPGAALQAQIDRHHGYAFQWGKT